jgi:DNA-binding LacI/PurR family transcriptional regulator
MRPSRAVTIAARARIAHVGSTTRSFSLSGNPKIQTATQERILALAWEAGYQTRLPGDGSLRYEKRL